MLAETAQKLTQKWLKEGIEQGELNEKHDVLIRQLNLKFGLTENEKDYIRNVEDTELLDSALDAVVTGETKQELLAKLN